MGCFGIPFFEEGIMLLNEIYEVKRVVSPPKEIVAHVPGSKSITNRALLIAAMCEGKCTLNGVLFSDDSRNFLKALEDLGFELQIDEQACRVSLKGCGGSIPCSTKTADVPEVYVGSAGTAARFLTAFLGMSQGKYRISASAQMSKRPMKELLVALSQMGAEIVYEKVDYCFPFQIGMKKRKGNRVVIDVEKSSQFLSALLILAPLFSEDFYIEVVGNHGLSYVEMTIKMMADFGVTVIKESNQCYCIPGGQKYQTRDYLIEPDISAACYFYSMAPILKIPACVQNVTRNSLQGDIQFLSVLEKMGCTIREEDAQIWVEPPKEELQGGNFCLSTFSDQALTLACLGTYANTPVTIMGISHIRFQECDRIQAIVNNMSRVGIAVEELADGITIFPGEKTAAEIDSYEDHRVAMSFSLLGIGTDGIRIDNPMCCRKTFEHYFEEFEKVLYN